MSRRARRRIAAGSIVGAALACVAVWFVLRGATPAGPPVALFVSVAVADDETRGDGLVRAGDGVHVTVRTEAGAYLTLLVLESSDRLAVPARTVNQPTPPDGLVQSFFTVDHQPGREQFLALVTRGALPDPRALVEAANGAAGDRDGRREALRDVLAGRLQAGTFTLEVGRELEHVP